MLYVSCKVAALPQHYSVEVNPLVSIVADWSRIMVYPVLRKYYVVLWAVTLLYLCNIRLHVCSVTIVMYLVIFCKTREWHSWFLVWWYCGCAESFLFHDTVESVQLLGSSGTECQEYSSLSCDTT